MKYLLESSYSNLPIIIKQAKLCFACFTSSVASPKTIIWHEENGAGADSLSDVGL